MNDADATKDEVDKAAAALNAAMEALGDPNVPEIGEAQGEAVHVESSAVILEWDQVKGCLLYTSGRGRICTGIERFQRGD